MLDSSRVRLCFLPSLSRRAGAIRSGKWKLWIDQEIPKKKLNVALFNLDKDPYELHDLSEETACQKIRETLLKKVLNNWDPDIIRQNTVERVEDYAILKHIGRIPKKFLAETLFEPPGIEDNVELL